MLKLLGILLLAPFAQELPVQTQDLRRLEDDQLRPLAESLSAALAARESTIGVDAARAALDFELEAIEEPLEGDELLGCVADLERAVWLSRAYSEKGLRPGKVSRVDFQPGGFQTAKTHFAYRLPPKYEAREESYPLILAIPPPDQEPAAHIRASWISREVRDAAILVCPEMPADTEDWDQVIVKGRPGGLSHLLTALRLASERFAVDFDRVYVVGHGEGVAAAIAAGNHAPQRFAGILGRGGDSGEITPDNFQHLPTFFAGAGAQAGKFLEAVGEAGFDNCVVKSVAKEQELWEWMLDNPREANPSEVRLVVGNPFPTRAYWLRLASIATDTRAIARIERETNTIRIESSGASHATLFLNDALVDLDKPLNVYCNGTKVSARLRRRPRELLGLLADGTSDPGCTYVAQVVFSMSEPKDIVAGDGGAEPDADFDARLVQAAEDAAQLWELSVWCASNQREAQRLGVLRRILLLDPDHELARAALGHSRSGEQWFRTQSAREHFEHWQEPDFAESVGYVRNKSLWMHPDERKRMSRGFEKDWETGQWHSLSQRRRLAKDWVLQDLEWIPLEAADRIDEGLWFAGGEWVGLPQANRRHARVDSMWRIPSQEVLLYSTVDREVALRAMHEMSRALPELVRVFGASPALPLRVAVLRDEEQYDRFAFGDPDGRRAATQASRMQMIHSAHFAESWFALDEGEPEFLGMGVCYWDTLAPNGDLYGVHSARLAMGLSYVEALDPSPKVVRKALSKRPGDDYYAEYLAEKTLPAWLRYGGAVYAERYYEDPSVATDGDRWWTRHWSLDNLRSRGGLRDLEELFAFELDPDDRDHSLKLLIEAGLLVAFALDGDCAPVREAHEKFKRALSTGRLRPSHLDGLREALIEHEAELRAFAEP